jgi:hypothetical protein
MQQMGQRRMNMPMPNSRMAAQQGLLRQWWWNSKWVEL